MTDDAVCHWRWLRDEDIVPKESALNFWMGQIINHCAWPEREHELVCPVVVPEPRCPK